MLPDKTTKTTSTTTRLFNVEPGNGSPMLKAVLGGISTSKRTEDKNVKSTSRLSKAANLGKQVNSAAIAKGFDAAAAALGDFYGSFEHFYESLKSM